MSQLPALTLEAAGSGRSIALHELGRPAVIICHGQDTAKTAIEVNAAVREQYPDPAQVLIASVIDLRQFPSMFHGMVKPELQKAYDKAAGKLPEGADPTEFVVLLPDWKGEATDALEVTGSTKNAAVLVAAASGEIVGRHQGEDAGSAAVKLLEGVAG